MVKLWEVALGPNSTSSPFLKPNSMSYLFLSSVEPQLGSQENRCRSKCPTASLTLDLSLCDSFQQLLSSEQHSDTTKTDKQWPDGKMAVDVSF